MNRTYRNRNRIGIDKNIKDSRKKKSAVSAGTVITGVLVLCLVFVAVPVMLTSCGAGTPAESGNVSNYGYVLVDNGNIYYTKIIESLSGHYSNIYKYNIKTQEETLVASTEAIYPNEMNSFLAIDKGELYFLTNYLDNSQNEASANISKIKPDGKNIEPVLLFEDDISCAFMQIVNGVIYYYDDIDQAIYRMNTDGTQKKFICDATIMSGGITGSGRISIGNNKIYFVEYGALMEVSVKGGEPKETCDFSQEDYYVESIVLDGNYIYYSDDSCSLIGRIRADGNGKPEILYNVNENTNEYISYFNVNSGIIYVVAENYAEESIYSVLSVTPGTRAVRQVVTNKSELGDISALSIWNDTIYFMGMPSYDTILNSDYVWFTVKKSGGKLTPFQPLNEYSDTFEKLINQMQGD